MCIGVDDIPEPSPRGLPAPVVGAAHWPGVYGELRAIRAAVLLELETLRLELQANSVLSAGCLTLLPIRAS